MKAATGTRCHRGIQSASMASRVFRIAAPGIRSFGACACFFARVFWMNDRGLSSWQNRVPHNRSIFHSGVVGMQMREKRFLGSSTPAAYSVTCQIKLPMKGNAYNLDWANHENGLCCRVVFKTWYKRELNLNFLSLHDRISFSLTRFWLQTVSGHPQNTVGGYHTHVCLICHKISPWMFVSCFSQT